MIAVWMLYATVFGAWFTLAALVLERGFRSRRMATRFVWGVAIVATLIAPVWITLQTPAAAPIAVATSANVVHPSGVAATPLSGAVQPQAPAIGAPARPLGLVDLPSTIAAPDMPMVDRILVVSWILCSLLVATCSVREFIVMRRARREWTSGVVGGTEVLLSRDVGPALFGILRPRVVLPAWALQLDSRSVELMLQHEGEHRLARDPMLLAVSVFAVIVAPWNIALWYMAARLRLAVEIDCDARVVASAGDVREYASLLASVGERMSSSTRLVPAFSQHTSSLERRIVAMVDATRPPRTVHAILAVAGAVLCVGVACRTPSPAKVAGTGRAPASLLAAGPASQNFYPRVTPMDTLDAQSIAWLRASVAKYYPAILAGDSSVAFVSLFVNDAGVVVNAAVRLRPVDLKPGERVAGPSLFLFGDSAYHYGGDSANKHIPAVIAERKILNDDGDSIIARIENRRIMGGIRTAFPRSFEFDSTRGTTIFDPFMGADPHAFQWDEDIRLPRGMVGPRAIEVHMLMLKPGRGSVADFGHQDRVRSLGRVTPIAASDTAAYSSLGSDVVAAVANCHAPACRPVIWSGPGRGELVVSLDSAASPGAQMQWHQPPEEPPPGGQAFQDSAWAAYLMRREAAPRPPVVWVDGVRRSFAWARANTTQQNVWGYREISAVEARSRLHDADAPNGAIVITTNAHAPPPPPLHAAPK